MEFDILSEMIKPTARVPLDTLYGPNKARAVLCEPNCPRSKVTICGLPEDAIVVKCDSFQSPSSIFANSKHECKRADYIIIANLNDVKRILYIEIKAGNKTTESIVNQLKGAMCFIGYCKEIARHFWNANTFLKGYEPRFVCFAKTSIGKKRTRYPLPNTLNDKPNKVYKILRPNPNMQFQELIIR